MESQPVESSSSPAADDVSVVKEMRQQLQERIESRRAEQHALLSSLQCLVPDLVSTLDLSLRLISAFHHRPFVPTPPLPPRAPLVRPPPPHHSPTRAAAPTLHLLPDSSSSDHQPHPSSDPDRLLAVRTAVAVCLLERVPFSAIDSAALLRKLEGDHSSATPAEKTALVELGGEDGPVSAIELALRRIAEENGGVELDELMVGGKSRIMVLGIDRSRLLKELPETAQQNHPQQQQQQQQQQQEQEEEELVDGGGVLVPRPSTPPPEMWMGPAGGEGQMPNGMRPPPPPHMFGPMAGMGGGGPRGMGLIGGVPRGMIGAPPLQGPSLAAGGQSATAGNAKPRTEEDDIKDLEALLSKKSFMEMQKSKTGEELLDLIHRPTAKETAVAAKEISSWSPTGIKRRDLDIKDSCVL